jgi:hypothetical protein
MATKATLADFEEGSDLPSGLEGEELVIDFSQIAGPEPVPDGTYVGEVVKAEKGTSKAGNPKLTVQWKIVYGEYKNRVIFDTFTLNQPVGLSKLKAFCEAVGVDKGFKGSIDELASVLAGGLASLFVTVRAGTGTDDQGEPYPDSNNIKRYKPYTGDVEGMIFGHP